MRKTVAVAAAAVLASIAPAIASAQPVSEVSGPDTYLQLHLGAFFPQGADLDAYDPGLALGATFGARFTPSLSAELGAGYELLQGSRAGSDLTLWDVPVMANLRARAPLKVAELSVFGGVGLHFATASAKPDGGSSTHESAVAFGAQAGGELAFNLSPTMRVGAEGTWSFVRPRLGAERVDLKGLRAAITVAYHF